MLVVPSASPTTVAVPLGYANSMAAPQTLDGQGVPTVCQLCEQLGHRWAVCSACGIEFPYQAADQLGRINGHRYRV
jgi:hypothetical protein